MREDLDRIIGDIAKWGVIAVVGIVATAVVILSTPPTRAAVASALGPPDPYGIGDKLDIDYQPGEHGAVIVYMSSACAACRKASLEMKGMVDAIRTSPAAPEVRLVSPEGVAEGLTLLANDMGLTPGAIITRPFPTRVTLVPAVIVINPARTIRFVQHGYRPGNPDLLTAAVMATLKP